MFLVFLVLILIPQNVATQAVFVGEALVLNRYELIFTERSLPKEWKISFETLNMMYGDNLKWSDEWAKKALEYLKSPKSVKADVVIEGEQSFNEDDTQSPLQKLLAFLEPRFDKIEKDLERLPTGTIYGCNGVINKKGNKDSISAACLYKKP